MRTRKKWYARDKAWPGKVHRSPKVMRKTAELLRAKRLRDQAITPEQRAARKRTLAIRRITWKAKHQEREQIVYEQETDVLA